MGDAREAATPSEVLPHVFYTTCQCAAILGIKPGTLEAWRSTGRGPKLRFRRIGSRAIRYLGRDVLAFLNDDSSRPQKRRRRGR